MLIGNKSVVLRFLLSLLQVGNLGLHFFQIFLNVIHPHPQVGRMRQQMLVAPLELLFLFLN